MFVWVGFRRSFLREVSVMRRTMLLLCVFFFLGGSDQRLRKFGMGVLRGEGLVGF